MLEGIMVQQIIAFQGFFFLTNLKPLVGTDMNINHLYLQHLGQMLLSRATSKTLKL